MDIDSLRRILTAFADSPANIDLSKGTLVVEIRDDIIEARLIQRHGSLYVEENGEEVPAPYWIVHRVARLPLLADRILSYLTDEPYFVIPGGDLLDQPEESPQDVENYVEDAGSSVLKIMGRRPAGTASIMYLTSDAGEGKTTLINHLCRIQAQRYKEKKQDWLLLPISLGGRTFMRFDDVIVGSLVNRLRFPYLYYDAFIELVRLGVIVPAFDGFEEMFVEGSSGDAISALGNLVHTLRSSGSILIAARRAYFEYKNLHSQTRLFDSMGGQSVSFARLSLRRWDKSKFLLYAEKRGIRNAEQIYLEFAGQLEETHPLLTRAVLVKRLLDVTSKVEDRMHLLASMRSNPNDYFRQFIGSIISREAKEKWIDKLGEVAQPLISESEHYDLLSLIALEMWINGTEFLRADVLEFLAEIFSDSKKKDKSIIRQIIERIKQHALIINAESHQFGFDHQEFYCFFLGEAIGKLIVDTDKQQITHALKQNVLPSLAVESAAKFVRRAGKPISSLIDTFNAISTSEPRTSYIKENLGGILVKLLDFDGSTGMIVSHAAFPPDSLSGRNLNSIEFIECYFQNTSLSNSIIIGCAFTNCEFENLDISENSNIQDCRLNNCEVRSVTPAGSETTFFAPWQVRRELALAGFSYPEPVVEVEPARVEPDEKIIIITRLLRVFLRSTGLNEFTLKSRLGTQSSQFFREILPIMKAAGLLDEVTFRGSGNQKRYQLGVSLERLNQAVENCGGDFERFVELATNA